MNKLPDTTFTVDNATEAAWIVDKLKEQGIDVSRVSKYIHVEIGFIYYYNNYVGFDYKTTQTACHTFKSYKVSELMTPLQDGAYQIEDSVEGKGWLEFLLLKLLLQGVINLYMYTGLMTEEVSQLRKGESPRYSGNFGYATNNGCVDFGMLKIYQHTVNLGTSISEIPVNKLPEPKNLFNQKYLVKIDSAYVEVYVVPDKVNPYSSHPNLVRVVDLVGEKFYWVYEWDMYSNNTVDALTCKGDLK